MAQQTIQLGTTANDGSGDSARVAGAKINDNFSEVYADIAVLQGGQVSSEDLFRSQLSEACNGAAGQVIAFTSQFVSTFALQIIDYDGIGIEVTAQDADGFTITSLSAGNFGYIALLEQ